MYDFLEEQLQQQFTVVETYHQSPEKTIIRLRHNTTKAEFVMRKFTGDDACYQKLLPIKSEYLPEIFEVTAKDLPEESDLNDLDQAAADEQILADATEDLTLADAAEESAAEEQDTSVKASKSVLVLEEFIEGDSLYKMLEDSLFNEKETRSIALNICRALSVLHSLEIIHRDIKPENIILRGSGAVLLDFDAARITKKHDNNTTDTHVLGTTGFAAPEQYGISQTDGRADIFALGVTMNLMMTGKHPSQELAPGRMGKIISRCIMVQPSKRYQTVEKLMEVLLS